MAIATTTTTIVDAAGMAETVVANQTITITVHLAAVVTPTSLAVTPAYRNVRFKPGKVMAGVTTATITVVAIGTVATVVPKPIRTCRRRLFYTAITATAWMKPKQIATNPARCLLGLETKSATTRITTADATGTEVTAADLRTIITTVTIANV
jgi:hypothetical protein